MDLLDFERDMIIAALRHYQLCMMTHGYFFPPIITEVATDDGRRDHMSLEEIDVLCEKVNV